MDNYNNSNDESTEVLTQNMNQRQPMNQGQPVNQGRRMPQPRPLPMNNMQQQPSGRRPQQQGQPSVNQRQQILINQRQMQQGRPAMNEPIQANNYMTNSNGDSNIGNNQSDKKKGVGTQIYTIISIALICGLIGLCIGGYIHLNNKIKTLNQNEDAVSEDLDITEVDTVSVDYETEIADLEAQLAEKDTQIAELTAQNEAANAMSERLNNIVGYLNTYSLVGGYSDCIISSKDITVRNGEDSSFTIYIENPDNGIYFEQENAEIAWIETTSDAVDGNPNVKGFTVHSIQPGDVTIYLFVVNTDEILSVTIHVVE